MSTSQKHKEFVRESMKDKDISVLAGVGSTSLRTFNDKGYTKAHHLFGIYLTMNCDECVMNVWLTEIVPDMNPKHRSDLIYSLREYYECIF